MTQKSIIKRALEKFKKSIRQIAEDTGIVEPSIRKILGQGTIKGEFVRIARGVYALSNDEGNFAYIECGNAVEVVKDLAAEGHSFDMVFLDIPYFSKQLIGRNRRKEKSWYKFLMPDEYKIFIDHVNNVVKPDGHVYLMLSGAPSAEDDMMKYVKATCEAGFRLFDVGSYSKTYKDGKPVLNIRGKVSASEQIYLFSKSGKLSLGEIPYLRDHSWPRPNVKKSYNTEKPEGLIKQIIRQSTVAGELIIDFFTGSGVMPEQCLKLGRNCFAVEIAERVVNRNIVKRLRSGNQL